MPSNDTISNKNSSDVVFSILNGTLFKLNPDEEKLRILKAGRPQPDLSVTIKDTTTNFNKTFQPWYSIHKWLCGSETYNKVFCWPCLLMRPETSSWCSTGIDDLKKFPFLATKHSLSKSHLKAVSEYNETLTSFDLPLEFVDESNFECKEEDTSGQTDDENDVAVDSENLKKQKSMEDPGESKQGSFISRDKPKITFKTWQEIYKNSFPVSKEKFTEDLNLYKWKRKIAKQEFRNAKLMGEKLKLEIEMLKAKAEYYKSLKEKSNNVPDIVVPD